METAAVGVSPIEGGPEQLVILVVLRKGYRRSPQELKIKFSKAIQSKLNPLFKVGYIYICLFCFKFCAYKSSRNLNFKMNETAGGVCENCTKLSTNCFQQVTEKSSEETDEG